MKTIARFCSLTVLVVSAHMATAVAQTTPNYFPLQEGNQWVYKQKQGIGEPFTVRVTGRVTELGRSYFKLEGFPQGDLLLRNGSDGVTYFYDPNEKVEKVWLRSQAPAGSTYSSGMDPCSPNARVETREGRYSGPLGEYGDALVIRYPPATCNDAGLTEEIFLQFVGLVSRTELTIAGPRTFELVYASIGGTSVGVDGLSFQLTLDKSKYFHNLLPVIDPDNAIPKLLARLTLRHNGPDPIVLTFSSSQTYDLAIKNERGETVYFWSADKLFLQAIREEVIPPGERSWVIEAPLGTSRPLPAGKYTAEAWLTTTPTRQFVASVGFTISDGR
jgi:hypothetical protein